MDNNKGSSAFGMGGVALCVLLGVLASSGCGKSEDKPHAARAWLRCRSTFMSGKS